MTEILTRAGCFVTIILMGYLLRRVGFFKKEDFYLLSRIVIRITLTAAIVTTFAGRELDISLLVLILIGFSFGVVMMAAAYFLNRAKGSRGQAFALLNSSGVNIGNFVLPFAQGFLGPAGVMAVSLFDVGNSLICLGGAYSVAGMIQEERKRISLLPMLRLMGKSIPLLTYVVMSLLCFLHIGLPSPVVELAKIIGSANTFLAMLMLGVGFQISRDRSQAMDIVRVLLPRYAIGIALAALCYFALPLPLEYRQGLIIPFLGPIASAAPAFTAELKGNYGLASAINSISILISIVLIIGALLVML